MKKQLLFILSFLLLLPTFLFSQTPEQMSKLYEYFSNKDTRAAITFSYGILDSDPGNSYIMYVLAWAYAMENNIDSSLTWIEKSIMHGNTDYLEFKRDSDFEAVHSHPEFRGWDKICYSFKPHNLQLISISEKLKFHSYLSHPLNELIELGKQQAIKKNEEKAIHLKTGEWNNFELESQYDLPKIDMSLSFDHENFYIKDTDDFMEKLKADGYDVEYIRVDSGGHGNFSVKKMVMKWLEEKFER